MRRIRTSLFALLTAVITFASFSVMLNADSSVIASGTTENFDWELDQQKTIKIKCKASPCYLKDIPEEYFDQIYSVEFDLSSMNSLSNVFLHGSGCPAEKIRVEGFEDRTASLLYIYSFPDVSSSNIHLEKEASINNLFFYEMGFSSVDFLADVEVWMLSVNACKYLKSVDLNDSISSLTASNCPELQSIKSSAQLRYLTVSKSPKLEYLELLEQLRSFICRDYRWSEITIPSYCYAELSGDNLKIANLDQGRKKINNSMFEGCASLSSVNLNAEVTEIGESAFEECKSLRNIDLPGSVSKIGNNAFYKSGLESVKIPLGVSSVGEWVFANCDNLKTVYIHKGVSEIDDTAFANDYYIKDVYYGGTQDQWDQITVKSGETANDLFPHSTIHFADNINCWKVKDGNWYYYDSYGAAVTGWNKIKNNWYLFDQNGVMSKRWKQVGGAWYYFGDSGIMKTEWASIGGSWYYFGGNGMMRTGWQEISGSWYYFGTDGAMRKSWQSIGGIWYYFGDSGAMKTGWISSGSSWYYLDSSGATKSGWLEYNGNWYYLDSSGVMITGWKQIGNSWYYFKSNGAMASNEYREGYYINPDGTWTYKYKASWHQNSKGWWFGDDHGWYAKDSKQTINGKVYIFDANGYCKNP